MRKLIVVAALGALAILVVLPAVGSAASTTLKATLSGKNEVPGKGDPDGSGTATLRIDPAKGTVCYTIKLKKIGDRRRAHPHRQEGQGRRGARAAVRQPVEQDHAHRLRAQPAGRDAAQDRAQPRQLLRERPHREVPGRGGARPALEGRRLEQALRGELRALGQRAELRPADRPGRRRRSRRTCRSRSRCRRSRARGRRCRAKRPIRSATSSGCSMKFVVVSSTPGTRILSSGMLRVAPHRPLVRVARVGRLEQERLRLRLQHAVDDLLERRCRGGAGLRSCPSRRACARGRRGCCAARG